MERARAIVAGVFGVPLDDLTAETGPEQIPAWDSLGHLALVQAVETELGILLTLREIFAIVTVGALHEVLAQRGLAE